MYCNQCGCEINDTAKFCKKCGAIVEDEVKETSEFERKLIRFFYTKRKVIAAVLVAAVVIAGAAVGMYLWHGKTEPGPEGPIPQAVFIDLKDEYEMEDNELILDPMNAIYSDGTMDVLSDYKVYIDTYEFPVTDGKIDGKDLYDGMHLIRLEWTVGEHEMSYEKTVGIKHKIDTWAKYPNIVGRTGKEISAAYGALSSPEFGKLSEGDWGYAYVKLPALNLRLTFPAGMFDNPENYGESDAGCIEMTGTLGDLFYNMESEMTPERLAEILGISLSQSSGGGCSGTLENGNQIYIGVGEVSDGIYMPTTTVRVITSESKKQEIFEYFF